MVAKPTLYLVGSLLSSRPVLYPLHKWCQYVVHLVFWEYATSHQAVGIDELTAETVVLKHITEERDKLDVGRNMVTVCLQSLAVELVKGVVFLVEECFEGRGAPYFYIPV